MLPLGLFRRRGFSVANGGSAEMHLGTLGGAIGIAIAGAVAGSPAAGGFVGGFHAVAAGAAVPLRGGAIAGLVLLCAAPTGG
jgi:hypothetical protein